MNAKMKTRDIITVVLLSLCNIVIFSLGTFLYLTPITILMMPVFYSLLQGIVFFMLGVKVKKKGAILLYCVIQGVIGFNIPYILMFVLAGIIGEAVLAKRGYGDEQALTVSYVVMQVLASIGSTIYPYGITLQATLDRMHDTGSLSEYVSKAGGMIQSWGSLVLLVIVFVCAVIGALLGRAIMRRHLLNVKK